jgi:DNA repair protein RadC
VTGTSVALSGPHVQLSAYRVELVRERSVFFPGRRFDRPGDAAALFRQYVGLPDREHLVAIWLDARRRMSGIHTVAVGGLSDANASPREVFKAAIVAGADALVLVHNHPSGDPSPTPEDIAATERLAIVAELIGIPLLDHVVVGDPGHTSLRDLRLMPPESMAPGDCDAEEDVQWAEEESDLGSRIGAAGGPAFLAVPDRTVTLNPIITVQPDPGLRPGQIEPLVRRLQNLIAGALEHALRDVPAIVEIEDVALTAAAEYPVFPAVAGGRTFPDTTAVAEAAEALMNRAGVGDLLRDSTGRAFRYALWASYTRKPSLDLPVSDVFDLDGNAAESRTDSGHRD